MRVRDVGVAVGDELSVDYASAPCGPLATAEVGELPRWYAPLLGARSEDGYYAHLRHSPPATLLSTRSDACGSRLRVVAHGPWRVLWLDGVEQGMTYHPRDLAAPRAASSPVDASVVGFDYQRTMVAAATALLDDGRHVDRAESTPRVLLVGLGAGSCAAALHAHARGAWRVEAVELCAAVAAAAARVHSVAFDVDGHVAASRQRGNSPIRVTIADAAVHMAALARGADGAAPLRLVLLDAYDGRGRVPAHLQRAPFLRDLAASLAPGGAVLANLFHGRHTEFARALRRALGGRVFSLRVKGHEQNIVLLATKGPAKPSDEATVRARLAHAAHASRGGAVDGPMAATMESNAATVGIVDDV